MKFLFINKVLVCVSLIGGVIPLSHTFMEDNSGCLQKWTKDSCEMKYGILNRPKEIAGIMVLNLNHNHSN